MILLPAVSRLRIAAKISTALLVVAGLALWTTATAGDPVVDAMLAQGADDSRVIAMVNDAPITNRSLRIASSGQQVNKPELSTSEARSVAFRNLVREKTKLQEAIRRDIGPTEQQINDTVNQQKALFIQMKAQNPTKVQSVARVIQASGMSEDEWWQSQRDSYANGLRIALLQQKIIQEAGLESALPEAHCQKPKGHILSNLLIV